MIFKVAFDKTCHSRGLHSNECILFFSLPLKTHSSTLYKVYKVYVLHVFSCNHPRSFLRSFIHFDFI